MVSGKILNKVNLVNDWGTRLKEELGRKPYGGRSKKNMGVAENVVLEAIRLSKVKQLKIYQVRKRLFLKNKTD